MPYCSPILAILSRSGGCLHGGAYQPEAADRDEASSLVALRVAAARRAAADRALLTAVAEAREHHVTWAAIGEQLGTTGEAARQRYGELAKQ
jgi:hypothetical protein